MKTSTGEYHGHTQAEQAQIETLQTLELKNHSSGNNFNRFARRVAGFLASSSLLVVVVALKHDAFQHVRFHSAVY